LNEAITAYATLAIAALTLVSVGVAYVAFRSQVRSFSASVSADMALKLLREFDSETLIALRGRVAQGFLVGHPISEAEILFDFLEQVGFFLRKGLIEVDVAHSFFFHWVNIYWLAGKSMIEKKRDGAEGLWKDFEYLYRKTLEVEASTDHRSRFINPSSELLRACLEEELV